LFQQKLKDTIMKTKLLAATIALIASGAASANSITVYGGSATSLTPYTAPGSSASGNFNFTGSASQLSILGFNNTSAYTGHEVLTSVDVYYTTTFNTDTTINNMSGFGTHYGPAQTETYTVVTSGVETLLDPTSTIGTVNLATTGTATVGSLGSTDVINLQNASGTAGTITTSLSTYASNWDVTLNGTGLTTVVTGGADWLAGPTANLTTTVEAVYNYTTETTVPEPASIALIAAGLAGIGMLRSKIR
jgi:hypothetical protein